MKTIYIDSDYRCHSENDGTMTAVEDAFFDGKCDAFIAGYRLKPAGETWVREDGETFSGGKMIAPWKDFSQLDSAQRAYEQAQLADMAKALNKLGVTLDENMDAGGC